nr:immunoglobulin heavy chain junction region [Mus musculus]MBK4184269.1 immunoglobulin heavy chain junction region [Mus musculus]
CASRPLTVPDWYFDVW